MTTFQLTDDFGLNVAITPAKGALSKYFQNRPNFLVANRSTSKSVWKSNSTFTEGQMSIGLLTYKGTSFSPANQVNPEIRAWRGSRFFVRSHNSSYSVSCMHLQM